MKSIFCILTALLLTPHAAAPQAEGEAPCIGNQEEVR